jgi:hypothetical protein
MALKKSERSSTCFIHVCLYTLPFLLLTHSWKALAIIAGTHFIIDRFGVARYLVWLKNHIDFHGFPSWKLCSRTGFFDERTEDEFTVHFTTTLTQSGNMVIPPTEFEDKMELLQEYREAKKTHAPRPLFVTVWLTIIADNSLHLLCNFLALKYS